MRAREISAFVRASCFVAAAASVSVTAAVACSSSDSAGPTAPIDTGSEGGGGGDGGGSSDAPVEASFDGPTQMGRIIDAIGKGGVPSSTITIAGQSVTTGDDGIYHLSITKNVPTSMTVTAPDHFKLNEQEWIVKTDLFDRGDTSLLSSNTAMILGGLLPAHDPAKGLLAVRIYPLPPCTSEEGSTLTLSPAGTSKLTYFKGGLPDKTATSATKDSTFSGVFTDVEPGVPITVTVTSPDCDQLVFPVDYAGVTLTGKQQAEPGDVTSYLREFLGPTKIADSGTD